MNIGALPDLILSWFKNQGLDLLQPSKDQAVQGQFTPGQQYQGQVMENLPNGRNLVQVAGQALDMALPQQAKPGDVIRLTYVQSGPRPTFVLNTSPAAESQSVTLSQAAQQVSALVRYAPVTAATPVGTAQAQQAAALANPAPTANAPVTTPVGTAQAQQAATLANSVATATFTGQAVAKANPIIANPAVLLTAVPVNAGAVTSALAPSVPVAMLPGEAVDGAHAGVATNTNLNTAQAVLAEQSSNAQVVPMRLQQTVKESGMFYESHLGKWVRGEIGLESVLKEPQAGLAKVPGNVLNLPDLAGMPEKAANLASRQLNLLDGAPFVWQGQAWPGQNVEWQVAEREGGGNAGEEAAQKWHSQLRLTLPRLGGVAANLDIGALGLRIRLTAQTPEALAEMRSAMPELAQRMRDSKLNLTSLKLEPASDRA